MIMMALRMLLGQRSRSPSSGRRTLVNVIAREPLMGFEPKLIHKHFIHSSHELITFFGFKGQNNKRFPADENGLPSNAINVGTILQLQRAPRHDTQYLQCFIVCIADSNLCYCRGLCNFVLFCN